MLSQQIWKVVAQVTKWDFVKSVNDKKPILIHKVPLQISNTPQE